jgi:NPCBM/NEW2 domain
MGISNFKFQILFCLPLFVSQAPAGTTWNLTDAAFHSRAVSIDSIDAAGIHSGSELLGWNDVLEISQTVNPPAAASGRLSLIFRGGDKLNGAPISFNGDTLQWNSERLGQIGFPVDSLGGILQNGYAGPDLEQARTDDVVRLANGDTMHGIINAVSPAGVTMQIGDATPMLGWDSISAVLFATAAGNPGQSGRRMFRVRLAGDEAVDAADVSLAADQLTITLNDKSTRRLDAGMVAGIEQLNGPIAWITSRKPSENIYKPLFSEDFPTRFDRTVADGKPIRERYPGFHHGIGCHSYSKLVYALDGGWAGFRTQFAIDSDSPLADVTVRIYLDDKPAFEEKNVKAGRIHPVVVIPLKDAKTISLEVDYGENYATEDRFVWLDPVLVRTIAPAATQP